MRINSQSIDEIFKPGYSQRLKTAYPLVFKDKLSAGGNDYIAEIVVGNKRSGNMVLYDIVEIRSRLI